MTLPALPYEIWCLIAEKAKEDPQNGEQLPDEEWQLPWVWAFEKQARLPYQEVMHPLKALSQTCKAFEVIASPLLWRSVTLNAQDEESKMPLLKQLCRALAPGSPASSNLQSLDIDIQKSDLEHQILGFDTMIDSWKDSNEEALDHFPTLAIFDSTLDELGRKLANCTKLTHFGWRGSYRPTASMYASLAQCPNLYSLSLDLGSQFLPNGNKCRIWSNETRDNTWGDPYPAVDDPLDVFKDKITTAALGFGGWNYMICGRWGIDEEGAYKDMRDEKEQVYCNGLLLWLGFPNKLRHLTLGAPILYHQSWLVPLWAQLHTLEDTTDRHFGEQLEDIDRPLAKAAQSFRGLLLQTQTTSPRAIFDLIYSQSILYPWRKWFVRWEDATTREVMEEVQRRLTAD